MQQLCTFHLSGYHLAIDVDRVREVVRHGVPTTVPLAPHGVVGLINLRGQIATVVDLGALLGRPPMPIRDDAIGVVLRGRRGVVSLMVDVIGDVLDVADLALEPPPETLQEPAKSLISGTYSLEDGLVLVLDSEKAVPKYEESQN